MLSVAALILLTFNVANAASTCAVTGEIPERLARAQNGGATTKEIGPAKKNRRIKDPAV